ncbi:MAG: type II secretion system protein F [Haliea sp.]|jgi:general secretion pathway protein F|nr:type II secretion system protein F [Haliea sp.]MAL94626.1 type II secretion system protein F [Haliea sp.]|tara:strand:+ start:3069 stop:4271 length:1203 start_codon:yes stop_codon:yes gene_type:complete
MAHFSYRAIGRDGRPKDGSIEAEGLELASRQLRAQGLTLLSLQPGEAQQSSAVTPGAIKRQAILAFTSELAVLLRAGLPLDRSLRVLIDMAAQAPVKTLLQDLLKSVKGGKSLSQALAPHEALFGGFYLNMVRAGEASGQLSAVLDRLVEYLENARANRDTVVSALIYPAILLVVSILSIVVMLGFVVPQFETLFEDMGEALPPLTAMVIAAADFIKAWGWLLALLVAGAVMALRNWLRTPEGRAARDQRLLRLPLAGSIVFQFEVAKFARTLGTLLGNGVSLLKAISIAIDTVDNVVVKEALQVLPPAVKAGRRMSVAMEETRLFTPMVIQMTRVGEESGSLDYMMLELARVFDQQVQAGVKRGLTLLEPVLILGMGFVIAVIIIAILMGILSVNDLAI